MKQQIGTLNVLPSGRWAIFYPGEGPDEITSGDQFYIEIPGSGSMELTRMESGAGRYYSVDGYTLRPGLRASFVGNRFWQ